MALGGQLLCLYTLKLVSCRKTFNRPPSVLKKWLIRALAKSRPYDTCSCTLLCILCPRHPSCPTAVCPKFAFQIQQAQARGHYVAPFSQLTSEMDSARRWLAKTTNKSILYDGSSSELVHSTRMSLLTHIS